MMETNTNDDTSGEVARKMDDATSDVHKAIDKALDAARPAGDRIAASAHQAGDKLAEAATQAATTLDAKNRQLTAAQSSFTERCRIHVRDKPMTPLARSYRQPQLQMTA